MFRVKVAGEGGLRDLARDLRRAGNGLPGAVSRELRKPTKRLGEAVRDAILRADMRARNVPGAAQRFPLGAGNRLPVKRPTAAAVKWSVQATGGTPKAEITFNPARVPARIQALFPYWVGQKKRLSHPLMGNRSTWIRQQIPNVWDQTRKLAPLAQSAAARALDEAADIINGRR